VLLARVHVDESYEPMRLGVMTALGDDMTGTNTAHDLRGKKEG